eukprot:symbB.v1.2.040304.t1/scaffold7134.1/size13104/1
MKRPLSNGSDTWEEVRLPLSAMLYSEARDDVSGGEDEIQVFYLSVNCMHRAPKQERNVRIVQYKLLKSLRLLQVGTQSGATFALEELRAMAEARAVDGVLCNGMMVLLALDSLVTVDEDKQEGLTQQLISDMFLKMTLTLGLQNGRCDDCDETFGFESIFQLFGASWLMLAHRTLHLRLAHGPSSAFVVLLNLRKLRLSSSMTGRRKKTRNSVTLRAEDARSAEDDTDWLPEQLGQPLERPCSVNNLQELEDNAPPNFSGEWLLVKAEGDWDSFLQEMEEDFTTSIIASKQWQAAAYLLDKACQLSTCPKLMIFNSVINTCGRAKHWRNALHFFQELGCLRHQPDVHGQIYVVQDDKLQLDVISFNAAISSCAKSMNWLWAMQLLDDLQQSELETDGISFNAALSAAAGWQTAFRLLEQMDLCQLQRDIVSFNAAISACDWQHALMLLEKMQCLLMQPQTITCSSAITSCGLEGRWEEALHLFESLDHPDLIALNALISACEKGAAWQAALDLTFVTLPSSLRANLITYNAALSACEKSGQWQHALAILAQLSDKDAISYNACISACGGVSQWQPALLLMSEVQSQGLADVVTCAASVDACSQAGLWQQALLIFFDMQPMVGANVVTYGAAVGACASGFQPLSIYDSYGRWELAVTLLWNACEVYRHVSVILFNMCIAVCESCRRWEMALQLWHELQLRSLQTDVMTYSGLISSCSACEQWQAAMELVSGILSNTAVQPDDSGKWELALAFFADLQFATMQPDVPTYNAAMSACERNSSWQWALHLLGNMRSTKLPWNLITCSTALRASEKGKLEMLATSLFTEMQGIALIGLLMGPRTMASAMNYGVGVMTQIIDHHGNALKVTLISPKGTSTSTILINGEEQESVDPMDGRAVKVVPTWRGKELEVKTRWASTLKELPINRRFFKDSQMIIESTTASGLVVKRIFEEKGKKQMIIIICTRV